MEIRRAKSDDWRESKQIRLQALDEAPMAFASTYADEAEFADEVWQARIDSSAQFLAFVDSEVVGTATGFVPPDDPDTVVLVAMFVRPEARGLGIAAELVAAVVDDARARGAERVTLHVVDDNHVARRLYERCGFRPTGETMKLPHSPEVTETAYAFALT